MPCVAGELCQIHEKTPEPPDVNGCYGGCGGRLHGISGEVKQEGDSELRRSLREKSSQWQGLDGEWAHGDSRHGGRAGARST